MHWVPTGQTVNKEYYVEVLKGVQEEASTDNHQDNAPVHNSILVIDYLTKMGIKTVPHRAYSPDLAPCDFWLFPKLRGYRYETIEMNEAVTKVIDTLTRGLPWGLSEVVGTVQRVHCSRRRLFRRGIEFHVFTINKSAHTKKAWKLLNNPCIFSVSSTFFPVLIPDRC